MWCPIRNQLLIRVDFVLDDVNVGALRSLFFFFYTFPIRISFLWFILVNCIGLWWRGCRSPNLARYRVSRYLVSTSPLVCLTADLRNESTYQKSVYVQYFMVVSIFRVPWSKNHYLFYLRLHRRFGNQRRG